MQAISLGHVGVMFEPSAPASSQPSNQATRFESRNVSLAEAQRSSGFRILQPTTSPTSGAQLDRVQQIVSLDPPRAVVATTLTYRQDQTRWIIIEQRPHAQVRLVKIPVAPQQLTVGGRSAVTYNRDLLARGRMESRVSITTLLWEVGELLIVLDAINLPEEDAIKVAESLR